MGLGYLGFRLLSWDEWWSPFVSGRLSVAGFDGLADSGGFFAAGFSDSGAGAMCGLIVNGLPTLGFTTNGFGPGLPSAVFLGPEPAGGIGVLPAGRAAAWGPAGLCSSAASLAASAARSASGSAAE